MTQSPLPNDQLRLHSLISKVMDGKATVGERGQLTEWLRADASARDEYLAYVDMHAGKNLQLRKSAEGGITQYTLN